MGIIVIIGVIDISFFIATMHQHNCLYSHIMI